MLEFRIFRVIIEKTLYSPNTDRKNILRILIKSKPKDRFVSNRIDAEWVITNVTDIDEDSLKFFLGKKQEIELSQLDKNGDIINRPENDIPHSIVFVHLDTGISAIQLNSEVASTSLAISKRLQILFNKSGVVNDLKIGIKVLPMRVSTDFAKRLQDSYKLLMIQAAYNKPNPPDSFRLVQQPLQNFLAELDGESVKVKFVGEDLEREPAIDLASTAMRTGNHVSAKIQDTSESAIEVISSSEEEIVKFYVKDEELMREDGDRLIINQMLKTADELAPSRG